MKELIKKIEDIASLYFLESAFKLNSKDYNIYKIEGNSSAINNIRNDKQQINVLKWFKNYWAYFEMRIIPNDEYPTIFLSISIFEGEADDDYKIQLFRAEWDNYEDNSEHPQPHWHFYPFNSFEEYDTFKELVNDTSGETDGFQNFVDGNAKVVDLSKFHFAMNGQWYLQKGHISRIDNDSSLVNWISGVFGHMKYQLNYIQ